MFRTIESDRRFSFPLEGRHSASHPLSAMSNVEAQSQKRSSNSLPLRDRYGDLAACCLVAVERGQGQSFALNPSPNPLPQGERANSPFSSPLNTPTAGLKAAIPASAPAVPPFLPGRVLPAWPDDCATRSFTASARSRGCRSCPIKRGAAREAGFWFQDSVTCVTNIQEPRRFAECPETAARSVTPKA
jgi:hypothetical protein